MKYSFFALFCILITFTFSCREKVQLPSNKLAPDSTAMKIAELNVLLAQVEEKQIAKYADSVNLGLKFDQTGIWLNVDSANRNGITCTDTVVKVEYHIELLNGDTAYTFFGKKAQVRRVGKSEKQRGLDIVLARMHEGDKAVFVVPSPLGFGALGDRNAIPPRASLVYKIKSVSIK